MYRYTTQGKFIVRNNQDKNIEKFAEIKLNPQNMKNTFIKFNQSVNNMLGGFIKSNNNTIIDTNNKQPN